MKPRPFSPLDEHARKVALAQQEEAIVALWVEILAREFQDELGLTVQSPSGRDRQRPAHAPPPEASCDE